MSGLILVLLSTSVERFGVSRMRDFFSALLKMRWFSHSKLGRKRMTEFISQSVNYEGVWRTSQATPALLNMVDLEPFFSLNGRQAECYNRLFLHHRHDQICVQLARSKSLATHASFTDYAGNGKQILMIMEDKENKRVLNKCLDFHCTRIACRQSEFAPWPSKWTAKWRKEEKYKL